MLVDYDTQADHADESAENIGPSFVEAVCVFGIGGAILLTIFTLGVVVGVAFG